LRLRIRIEFSKKWRLFYMEKTEGSSKRSEENLVKKTCKELGITQKELAEITKIDRGSLSRWNLNKRKIPEYIEQYLILLSRLNSYEKVIN
jgi:hypothetical protein